MIFGITGDLARVMTFRSLYRLERRGLLDCPIVGVAFDDWTLEKLITHARDSIVAAGEELDEDVFERLAQRLSYHHGDFGDAATYAEVAKAIEGKQAPGLLPRDPAVALRHGGGRPRAGRAHRERPCRRREAVRARPRIRSRAGRGAARLARRVADLPDRPLPREDVRRGHPLPPLLEHRPRAGLEPVLHLDREDHDGRELRHRRPRALLRPGRRDARRRPEPPPPGAEHGRDGGARDGASTSCATASATSSWRCPTRIRRGTSAASTAATSMSTASRRARRPRRTARCGSRSTTGAGRASRSSSVPASPCR